MSALAAAGDALADPWSQDLVRRALAEVVLLGIAGGLLGPWVVAYGLSYGAESLAHALFPGLVVAALAGLPLLLGGVVGLAVAGAGIAMAGRLPAIGRDTGVAVVVTTLLGLGVLLALSPQTPAGLQGLLFGDVLGVTDLDLALAAGLVGLLGAALVLLHARLLATGFDRDTARALGLRPTRVDLALLALLSATLLVAVQGLGNLLVLAVLVAPAATARLVARRMVPAMTLSAAIAVIAGVGGLYLSYHGGTAAGASVAAVLVGCHLVAAAVAVAPRPGRRQRPERAARAGAGGGAGL